ncbi:hypothetical protein GGE24_001783 [Bradyrhizobium centrosematis]|nr:hypothetical protein [Bradyrhizobium centrosematis]MCS3772471.1 hypothetical protein [Bradyrhizobium centrosematis]
MIEINETRSSGLLQRKTKPSFDQFGIHHEPARGAAPTG